MATQTQGKAEAKVEQKALGDGQPAGAPKPEEKKQEKKQRPVTLAEYLEVRQQHIAEVATKALDVGRLIKLAGLAWRTDSRLAEARMDSIFNAVMRAAQLGLEPNGPMGDCYLVPYKEKGTPLCRLDIGYRGLLKLARRSGTLESAEARVVYSSDDFLVRFGTKPLLRHKPTLEKDRGEVLGVYCLLRMKDGSTHVEVMRKDEVEHVQASSRQGGDFSPWKQHWDEMARKTVVRRACKYVELAAEVYEALAYEDNPEGETVEGTLVEAPPAQTRTAALKEKVREKVLPQKAASVQGLEGLPLAETVADLVGADLAGGAA